jgi:hypothetical protein
VGVEICTSVLKSHVSIKKQRMCKPNEWSGITALGLHPREALTCEHRTILATVPQDPIYIMNIWKSPHCPSTREKNEL